MSVFLTAQWKYLVFANYEVEASVLEPYLPVGTELDTYNGKCLASLVGFLFLNTKVKGIGFPFHRNFEEFNLRFYVRRKEGSSYKRGVVFVKEIVPKRMITYVAYLIYGEQYFYHPMKSSITKVGENLDVRYSFLKNRKWNELAVTTQQKTSPLLTGTEEEFITEHYWGYTRMKDGRTSEYQVQHPRWNIHPVKSYEVNVDVASVYGPQWGDYFTGKPSSVFMADGSPVVIFSRNIITQ